MPIIDYAASLDFLDVFSPRNIETWRTLRTETHDSEMRKEPSPTQDPPIEAPPASSDESEEMPQLSSTSDSSALDLGLPDEGLWDDDMLMESWSQLEESAQSGQDIVISAASTPDEEWNKLIMQEVSDCNGGGWEEDLGLLGG